MIKNPLSRTYILYFGTIFTDITAGVTVNMMPMPHRCYFDPFDCSIQTTRPCVD